MYRCKIQNNKENEAQSDTTDYIFMKFTIFIHKTNTPVVSESC